MSIELRPATIADTPGITATFLACWRGSYANVLPLRLVELMTDDKADRMWTRVLAEAAPGEVMVAVCTGTADVLGVTRFAVFGNDAGMVHSLYVSPCSQGSGVGAKLLIAAESALRRAGVEIARLWVFRDNAPSIGFYARQGWLPDGETRVQEEFGEPEIRLTHPLLP